MRLLRVRTFLSASLIAALPLLGCESLLGADFGPKTLQEPSVSEESGAGEACVIGPGSATPAAGSSGYPDLVFAVRWLVIGSEVDGGVWDGSLLGLPEAERGSCQFPPGAWPQILTAAGPTELVNAAASAAKAMNYWANVQNGVQGDINSGAETTVFRLTGYNRQSNDADVGLDFFNAARAAAGSDAHDPPQPTWTGTDTWLSLRESLSSDGPGWKPRVSLKGSVHDGVLETEPQDAPDWLAFARVHGKLELRSGEWHFAGTYAGAARITTLFQMADTNPGLCNFPQAFYDVRHGYKRAFCERRDVDTDGDRLCDALSLGQRFEAWPAKLGCEPSAEPPQCASGMSFSDELCDPAPAEDAGAP